MLRKLSLALLCFLGGAALAAPVELNQADQLQLEAVKGIGPVTATRIVEERRKGEFKDWQDFMTRVKGVGPGKAAQFSQEGLKVNGATWPSRPLPAALAPTSLTAELPSRR